MHNSRAHLLYKYCTNCTFCNWTVLTVITQKMPPHVQLHNSTAPSLYKYCTNCTVCNWTVLTVITHKLPPHVQLHNSTAHLLYKLYSLQLKCTYSNSTEADATFSAAQQVKTDIFWSWVQPTLWFSIYVFIKPYPQIRSYKEIQLPAQTLPQLHRAWRLARTLFCSVCKELFVCDYVIKDLGVVRHDVSGKRLMAYLYGL